MQRAFGVRGGEPLAHQSAEQPRKHLYRKEETGFAGYPAHAVGREAAARHDTMNVGMMGEGRAPGVEHHGDADLGAEMLGIGGDAQQRLRRGLEQGVVDHRLVGVGDVGDRRGQREDDMIIGHRQQLGPARFEPIVCGRRLTFRAMPIAARVVGDVEIRAVLAARDVAAERCRAAGLDRRHHAQLAEAQMAGLTRAMSRA